MPASIASRIASAVKRRRHEDHRGVVRPLSPRLPATVLKNPATLQLFRPDLPGVDTAHHLGAVSEATLGVKGADLPVIPLANHLGVLLTRMPHGNGLCYLRIVLFWMWHAISGTPKGMNGVITQMGPAPKPHPCSRQQSSSPLR